MEVQSQAKQKQTRKWQVPLWQHRNKPATFHGKYLENTWTDPPPTWSYLSSHMGSCWNNQSFHSGISRYKCTGNEIPDTGISDTWETKWNNKQLTEAKLEGVLKADGLTINIPMMITTMTLNSQFSLVTRGWLIFSNCSSNNNAAAHRKLILIRLV